MYYFLIAWLPQPEIGKPSPFTTEELDEILRENLPEKELEKLLSWKGGRDYPDTCRVYREMGNFENYLRTCIARKRAERSGVSFSGKEPDACYSEVDFGLAHAQSCTDPLEREYLIDKLRWEHLDELSLGHDFDFDAVAIYRSKLVIVNKYADFRVDTGTVNFTAALEKIIRTAGSDKKES